MQLEVESSKLYTQDSVVSGPNSTNCLNSGKNLNSCLTVFFCHLKVFFNATLKLQLALFKDKNVEMVLRFMFHFYSTRYCC